LTGNYITDTEGTEKKNTKHFEQETAEGAKKFA
jgi:hypothetical protein